MYIELVMDGQNITSDITYEEALSALDGGKFLVVIMNMLGIGMTCYAPLVNRTDDYLFFFSIGKNISVYFSENGWSDTQPGNVEVM